MDDNKIGGIEMKKVLFKSNKGYVFNIGDKIILTNMERYSKKVIPLLKQLQERGILLPDIDVTSKEVLDVFKCYGSIHKDIKLYKDNYSYGYSTNVCGGSRNNREDFIVFEVR